MATTADTAALLKKFQGYVDGVSDEFRVEVRKQIKEREQAVRDVLKNRYGNAGKTSI